MYTATLIEIAAESTDVLDGSDSHLGNSCEAILADSRPLRAVATGRQ